MQARDLNENQILMAAIVSMGIGKQGGAEGVPGIGCIGLLPGTLKEHVAGIDQIDACYVAETSQSIILAFRGTDGLPWGGKPPQNLHAALDWLNNFKAEPIAAPGFPGKVHTGFHRSVTNLAAAGFVDDVKARLATSKKQLVVTGYSKGAALVPLASWLLRNNSIKVDELHFYEPPRCGDAEFARAFDQAFPRAVRFEYQDDIVPHVPPTPDEFELLDKSTLLAAILQAVYPDYLTWNYKPVGTLQFANWDNQFVHDSKPLEVKRLAKLAAALAQPPHTAPFSDHMPKGHLFDVVKQHFGGDCTCPDRG
jgi:triacylglycerol lipase